MSNFREAPDEQDRIANLLQLLPSGRSVLEIGARDGYITKLLAERFEEVVALDLTQPVIDAPRVQCVAGDVRSLAYEAGRFDLVLCSEVLEHIPSKDLQKACNEISRVSARHIVVGVPFAQDLRVARTRCAHCGTVNPPYGHINSFDLDRIQSLFQAHTMVRTEFVGSTTERTNWGSDLLMRAAGYPWGTYEQDEPCIRCGNSVGPRPIRSLRSKVLSGLATRLDRALSSRSASHPKWVHAHFIKHA